MLSKESCGVMFWRLMMLVHRQRLCHSAQRCRLALPALGRAFSLITGSFSRVLDISKILVSYTRVIASSDSSARVSDRQSRHLDKDKESTMELI